MFEWSPKKKAGRRLRTLGAEAGIFIAAALYLSLLWLGLPYFQSSGGVALWHTGFAESLMRGGAFQYPENIAYPAGAPIVFGASLVYLQYALMWVFGLDGITSYSFVATIFAFVALGGSYSLARSLGAGKAIALALAVALLSQTFFPLHMQGYGAAGFGFALLPAVCVIFHRMGLRESSLRATAIYVVLVCAAMIFLAFLDGYTFIMALACGVSFTCAYLVFDAADRIKHLVSFCILSMSAAVAYLLYRRYVPDEGLPGYPLSIFAHLSLHLPSMFRPTAGYSILYDFLGLSVKRPPASYVGAGLGNHEAVFLTITSVILGLVALRLRLSNTWRAIALLMILGGLIMAIGPVVPESTGGGGASGGSAIRAPLMTSPAYPLYTMLPGLEQMRATYRWIAVVKLGVWILACLVCAHLFRRGLGEKVLAFVLILIIMIEGSSNPLRQWAVGRQQLAMANNLKNDLVRELVERLPAKSKLLVLPITNDFVVHSVAADADVFAYNVAGDKNLLIANSLRPRIISRIAEVGRCFLHDLLDGARQGKIDAVAFRTFDSHRGRYGWVWPPSVKEIEENRRAATALSRNVPSAVVEKGEYFWLVDARRIDKSLAKEQCVP